MNQDQNLDRSTLTGILLITIIMGVWLVFYQPPVPPPADEQTTQQVEEEPGQAEIHPSEALLQAPADSAFVLVASGEEELITVRSDRFEAVFSTKGATLKSYRLLNYNRAGTDEPVEMISSSDDGAIAVLFNLPHVGRVDTRSLYFSTEISGGELIVGESGSNLIFDAAIGEGVVRFIYSFSQNSYEFDLRIEEIGEELLTASGGFDLLWNGSIPFAEVDLREEAQGSGVYARSGGELVEIRLTKNPEARMNLSGNVEWVGVKNKFFLALIVPRSSTDSAYLEGARFGEATSADYAEVYSVSLGIPRPGGEGTDFHLYLGPMDMHYVGDVAPGVYRMVDYGFGAWMTRPIAEYVVGPLFRFFGSFLPSYGLVIILFGIIVKMAVYPLTKVSYKNTARMRELQPKLEEIKEKHADDPQKQQEAMMKMYREMGVNPLAGCLPLLLQYPIIIALWRYFQNSITIRQESFLWAADLSAPDPILHLPFSIPFYGDYVAGFTTIMGLSMIIQMRVAMPPSTGGMQAKIFMYVLPIFLFVIFNRLASGLSLYYLVFNLLTIIQQKMINKQMEAAGPEAFQPKPKKKKLKPGEEEKQKRRAPRTVPTQKKKRR